MKVEIKRVIESVLYTAEVPDDTTGQWLMRAAVIQAVRSDADLRGADLYGADLRGVDLSGADLYGANLSGANLSGADLLGEKLTKSPISIINLIWDVLITDGYMTIGCQRHTHAEWDWFDDEQIKDMHSDALAFWRQWRDPLLAMCAAHAAKESQ